MPMILLADDRRLYTVVQKNGLRLRHASKAQKSNKILVLEACKQNGHAFMFANPELQVDKDIVLASFKNGLDLHSIPNKLKANKEFMKVLVADKGLRLQHASDILRGDPDVVWIACQQNWRALEFAVPRLRGNLEFVQKIVALKTQNNTAAAALQHATYKLRDTKELVLPICREHGYTLQYATDKLRADKEIVLAAVTNDPDALKFSLGGLNQDKDCLVAAKLWDQNYGVDNSNNSSDHSNNNIKSSNHTSDTISRSDHTNNNTSSNHTHDNISRSNHANDNIGRSNHTNDNIGSSNHINDNIGSSNYTSRDISKVDHTNDTISRSNHTTGDNISSSHHNSDNISSNNHTSCNINSSNHRCDAIKIVLSTRFSLNAKSCSTATQFTAELKKHPFIRDGKFVVYSPNAFSKGTCDPEWTRGSWPCRGTVDTCLMVSKNPSLLEEGAPLPSPASCWRYSFRYQLRHAKQTNGFMIQVVDFDIKTRDYIFGKGQLIETEMARDVGTQVFRVYQPNWNGNARKFISKDIHELVKHVQEQLYNDDNVDVTQKKRSSRCDVKLSYF